MARSYATLQLGVGLKQVGFYDATPPKLIVQPIQRHAGERTCLMRWNKSIRLHSSSGIEKDLICVNPQLSVSPEGVYVITFQIARDNRKKKHGGAPQPQPATEIKTGALSISTCANGERYQLIYDGDNETAQVICLTVVAGEYTAEIVFHVVPESSAHTLVADFGSKAIQMLYYHSHTQTTTSLDLFQMRKEQYAGNQTLPNEHYLQYEPCQERHEHLYKNICFKLRDGRIVPFSTNKEAEAYMNRGAELVDNLKVGFLSGLQDVQSYSKILIDLFTDAVRYADIPSGDAIFLNMLIPNVMPYEVQSDISKQLSIALPDYTIDVRFFSESDAAFLGYAREHQLTPFSTYLIIDSGHGTTDWSVVKVNQDRHYQSEATGGFVGAGAMISFAILDHMLSVMLDSVDETRRRQYLHKIQYGKSTDLFGVKKLDDGVEAIKRNYGEVGNEEENVQGLKELGKQADALNPETIANYLQEHPGSYGDSTGIIHNAINRLVDTLLEQLHAAGYLGGQRSINQVILSGRAFRFPLFQQILTERFNEEGIRSISYDSQRAKSQAIYGVLDVDRSLNSNCGLYGSLKIESEFQDAPGLPQDLFMRSLAVGSSYLSKWFGYDSTPDTATITIDETFLQEGKEVTLSGAEILSWNGMRFQATDPGKFKLSYTGERLVLRDQNNVIVLRQLPKHRSNKLLESLSNQFSLFYKPSLSECVVTPSKLVL